MATPHEPTHVPTSALHTVEAWARAIDDATASFAELLAATVDLAETQAAVEQREAGHRQFIAGDEPPHDAEPSHDAERARAAAYLLRLASDDEWRRLNHHLRRTRQRVDRATLAKYAAERRCHLYAKLLDLHLAQTTLHPGASPDVTTAHRQSVAPPFPPSDAPAVPPLPAVAPQTPSSTGS